MFILNTKLRNTGFVTFFLSGICAISSGVIVSILRDRYGLLFSETGTLLSILSIGNILASFLAGFLPLRIGTKKTVLLLCAGYAIGYGCMNISGAFPLLALLFLLVGLAKGCALNTCTVLVGQNAENRSRGMSVMHACYAAGALLCPILISALLRVSPSLPAFGIAITGAVLWMIYLCTDLNVLDRPASANASSEASSPSAQKQEGTYAFLHSTTFWILTALVFCQNAAEQSVNGWLVTYFKDQNILSGTLANYTITIMWGATLIARLLIAFVLPIKNIYKALSIMGVSLTVLYFAMIQLTTPVPASIALFLFAFAMAGVNPMAISGVGKQLSAASMGILLPVAAIGAILMPGIIGFAADSVSLQSAMALNLVPCAGIFVLSFVMYRRTK